MEDIIGKVYGRLTVISFSEKRSGRNRYWNCLCECGNIVTVCKTNLKSGDIQSCGCYRKEVNIIHGLSNHSLYFVYNYIHQKCNNFKHPEYKYCGGMGIELKFKDIKDFKNWNDSLPLNKQWKQGLKLKRINTNSHYEPDNLRWV